jgi:hypothetical protein
MTTATATKLCTLWVCDRENNQIVIADDLDEGECQTMIANLWDTCPTMRLKWERKS